MPDSFSDERLRARLETMPLVEQAKGIIMAQTGCDAEEAFDRLRQASQRLNVPVRELAARIIATTVRASRVPDPRPRDVSVSQPA